MAPSTPAPVAPPSILTASMDEYVNRVLTQIPADKRGVVGLDASNAGVAISAGARLGTRLTGVGFISKTREAGVTYGSRVRFVF